MNNNNNNILLPKLMLRELLLIVYNICIFYCITSLLSHPPLSHLLLLAFFCLQGIQKQDTEMLRLFKLPSSR